MNKKIIITIVVLAIAIVTLCFFSSDSKDKKKVSPIESMANCTAC